MNEVKEWWNNNKGNKLNNVQFLWKYAQYSLASFQLLALLRSFCHFPSDRIFLSFRISFKFEENEKESLFQIFFKVSLFCLFEIN